MLQLMMYRLRNHLVNAQLVINVELVMPPQLHVLKQRINRRPERLSALIALQASTVLVSTTMRTAKKATIAQRDRLLLHQMLLKPKWVEFARFSTTVPRELLNL